MSVAAHHNDWLNLVEVSGPFLALPILMDALPAGLDKPESDLTADLWRAITEWNDEDHGGATNTAVHEAWVRYVFEHVLHFDRDVVVRDDDALDPWTVERPEHDVTLCPDLIIRDPEDEGGGPHLLVNVVTPDVSVTDPSETGWSASPAERMESLLERAGARLGIVTNGDQWTLVHVAEGENTGFATWYASLWREEPLTLRSFITLLGMRRFFAVAKHETLQALLDRSREDQQGVSKQLGKQVRRAIEILIQQIDRVDHDRGGRLLEGMTEERLYESAVTVMMRLIFLFYAEENDLLLLGDDFYDQNYAASTLREQLQATADESGEEILERLHDAWPRLLSTFRAVHTGVEHEQMRLPAYGGALFDPDRYPFLEGREPGTTWVDEPADPLPIDNRTVLHLLNAIQTLEVEVPGGGRENRPLSFRALDVEQVGHVYETLLDHTAVRAEDWVFGLEGTKSKEPEVPLGELEARADDRKKLVKYLEDETGRSAGALRKRVAAEEKAVYDRWGQRWTPAFQGDESTARRATPWGLLVREDSAEYPVVVPPGRVYVTESARRRSSGTHYTPRSLTEEIVTHALEPLVFDGPAEGWDRSDWELRSPGDILDLKVCDPACGSGAFLVQACRYLAERLVEAWNERDASDGPDGYALPTDPEERQIVARRYIADRCLYGVDINPLATEMAKLSLWLVTLQKNRPFTFLDHAIRIGDSLIGFPNLEYVSSVMEADGSLWSSQFLSDLEESRKLRRRLEEFTVLNNRDSEIKSRLLSHSDNSVATHRMVLDDIVARLLWHINRTGKLTPSAVSDAVQDATLGQLQDSRGITKGLQTGLVVGDEPRRPFHWPVEFAEVFLSNSAGFDAAIGNPPFLGGKKISTAFGAEYESLLRYWLGFDKGAADLSAHFVRRASYLANSHIGLVTTDRISQGATCRIGLRESVDRGWSIAWSVPSRKWPGQAQTRISTFHLAAEWAGECRLGSTVVDRIASDFHPGDEVEALGDVSDPSLVVSTGTSVYGRGFVLDDDERQALLRASPKSGEVIRPYLVASDLTGPAGRASRWVIDLSDTTSEDDADARYPLLMAHLRKTVEPQREGLMGQIHQEDFWRFWDLRPELYAELAAMSCTIACPRVSPVISFARVAANQVFADRVVVFATESLSLLGVLQSGVHRVWIDRWRTDMGTSPTYVVGTCFRTFFLPDWRQDSTLQRASEVYIDARDSILATRRVGLTEVYGLVDDPGVIVSDIEDLRARHVELSQAVCKAYGWDDIGQESLGHVERRGETIFGYDEDAVAEITARLVSCNRREHER